MSLATASIPLAELAECRTTVRMGLLVGLIVLIVVLLVVGAIIKALWWLLVVAAVVLAVGFVARSVTGRNNKAI